MINYSVGKAYNPISGSYSYRAYPQYTDLMDLGEFAEHMTSHGCVYGKGDVLAICTMIVSCIRELLLEGYRIQFGDLGTFSVGLKSTATDTYADFTASKITAVKAKLQLGDEFDDMLDDASFNHVMTLEEAAIAEALADASLTQATVAAAAGIDVSSLSSTTATLDTSGVISSGAQSSDDDDDDTATGTLVVSITPSTATYYVDDDSDTVYSSDEEVTLSVGEHTLTFSDVSGYTTPDSQTVTIAEDETTELTVSYSGSF